MKKWLLLPLLVAVSLFATAQEDDLMNLLDEVTEEDAPKKEKVTSFFKATRIINNHSVKLPDKGEMMFIVAHRFGRVNSGWREFFGIDQADMRLGFEYGATDWMSIGIGRSSFEKTYDGYVRFRLLQQTKVEGKVGIPVTIVWKSLIGINSFQELPDQPLNAVNRVSYAHQLMIARKFTDNFTFQIMPTFVHYNLVQSPEQDNDTWAIGFGGRYLITNRMSINAEYFQLMPGHAFDNNAGSLSVGIDIETGGHVFQIMVTNSVGMLEQFYIPRNQGWWWDGNVHLGFNTNRVFTLIDYNKRQKKKARKQQEKELAPVEGN